MIAASWRHGSGNVLGLTLGLALACPAAEPVLEPPTSTPGNHQRLAVGHYGAVEEGALIARGGGPEASWYNPAGLAGETSASLSGNASVFEYVEMEASGSGTSSHESELNLYPAFVGSSFPLSPPEEPRPWVLGLALVTTENWDQSVSFAETVPEDGGGERSIIIESSTELVSLVPTLAVGWRGWEDLDLGLNLGLAYLTYDDLRLRTARVLDVDGVPRETVTSSSRLDAAVWQLRMGIGAQWRIDEHWRLGVVANSPGLQISGRGKIGFDLQADNPTAVGSGRVRDEDVEVEVRVPWSLGLGLGYLAERWELEFDLTIFGDPGDYNIFDYDQQLRLDFVDKSNGASITVFQDLDETSSHNRMAAILALGGRFRCDQVWALHGGISYNMSPVDASGENSAFRDIDLFSLGLGLSRDSENVSSLMGLRFSMGEDDEIAIEDLLTGNSTTASLAIAVLTLSFSTAYRF